MDTQDKITNLILKYSNNIELKNSLSDITYLKHVIKFKRLIDFDEYKSNLKNACKLIYDNTNISDKDKELIFKYVKENA
jgi:hypothetical protein